MRDAQREFYARLGEQKRLKWPEPDGKGKFPGLTHWSFGVLTHQVGKGISPHNYSWFTAIMDDHQTLGQLSWAEVATCHRDMLAPHR